MLFHIRIRRYPNKSFDFKNFINNFTNKQVLEVSNFINWMNHKTIISTVLFCFLIIIIFQQLLSSFLLVLSDLSAGCGSTTESVQTTGC